LKPANVKLTPDGKVKVLDFGLAKAIEGTGPSSTPDVSHSPTMTRQGTEAGMIMGTAAYMSPEQARGKPVDKRADIWSFGVVLYEMLSGRRLFEGETVSDVLTAVLTKEPDWTSLPSGLPDAARRALTRCLVREPKNRLRDLGEIRLAFDGAWIRAEAAIGAALAPTPSGPRPTSGQIASAAGALFAGVLLGAGLMLSRGSRVKAIDAPTHVAVMLPSDTRLALGRGSAVALSPDGRKVAYTAVSEERTRLYLHHLDRATPATLDGTDGATNPFFSPDGQWIGFFADGRLKKVALSGGAPVPTTDALNPRGEAWGPDDVIYLAPGNAGAILRLSARDGSKREPATTLAPGEASHRWPALYADGRGLLYSVWNNTGWEGSKIAARTPRGETKVVVGAGGGFAKVVRAEGDRRSYLVYAREDGLLVAPFDEALAETTGPAVPLVDGLVTNQSGGAHFDLSANGTLAYAPGVNAETDRALAWVSHDGKPTPLPGGRLSSRFWALSKDGRRIARHVMGGAHAIWVDDLETRAHERVVLGDRVEGGIVMYPRWVGASNAIVYAQGAPVSNLVYNMPGKGGPVQLTRSDMNQVPMDTTADGRTLLYREFAEGTAADLWTLTLPAPGASVPEPVKGTPFLRSAASESDARFSPDGRFVAFAGNASGRFEVYVAPFPSGEPALQISTDGGYQPRWSPDGKEIFFRNDRTWMMSAAFSPEGVAPRAGTPRVLFDASMYEMDFSVAPDGKRFLMMPLLPTEGDATEVRLILNVVAEIRKRMGERERR
jgi:eukaryotic-like serine/threonine-protein kinase